MELKCDDFIALLERELTGVKSAREKLSSADLSQNEYEDFMNKSIQKMQGYLDGIRHTYIPLIIPEYLRIPISPPEWLEMSETEAAHFSQISADNNFQQRDIISAFRKPATRMVSIERAAKCLAHKQESVRDENQWIQADLMANSFAAKLRPAITDGRVNQVMMQSVKRFIDDTDQIIPYDDESALLFLISIFEDDGPLSSNIKGNSISEGLADVAATLNAVSSNVSVETWIGHIRPFIADLHKEDIIKNMYTKVSVIVEHLTEATMIIDDVSMADFGSEGEEDPLIAERVKSCAKFQGVERLAAKLQATGEAAIESVKGSKKEAAKMLAVSLIAQKATYLPAFYAYAIAWCSDSMYDRFTMKPLFMQAFDLIVNMIPDFEG